MKKITFMFMLVLGALVTSCSKSNTPEFVAEKFLTAMENANYPEAKKFCDEKTGQIVDMLAGIPIPEKDKKAPKKVIINRVEEDKENKDKAKAKVFYSVEGEEKEKSIDVVKIDGKWKVSLDKESKEEGHSHGDQETQDDAHEGHDHSHEDHNHETEVQ